MKNLLFDKLTKILLCTSCVCFFSVLNIGNLLAIPIQIDLLDYSGQIKLLDYSEIPIEIDKKIERNPDQFIGVMKNELRVGNLGTVGFIANILKKIIPENSDVIALYSLSLASNGDIENAKKELESVIGEEKTNIFALYAQAMIYHREGNLFKAEQICDNAIYADNSHPYPRNILGRIYFDHGKNKQALASFKKAVELESEFLPGYINLGAVSYDMGNNEQSIQYFKKAIELNPILFGPHYGLAVAYQTIGYKDLALKEYIRSYELNPSNATLLQEIGNIQLQLGKYTDAHDTGKQMLKMDTSGAHYILGSAALHLGNIEEAVLQLQKAPDENQDAAHLLGYCFIIQNEYTKALKQMENVYRNNASHFGSFAAKATLLFTLDQQVTVDKDLNNKWNDGTKKLLNLIAGCVYGSKGQWEEAKEKFQKAEGLINGFSIEGIDKNTLSSGLKKDEFKYIALGVLLYMYDLTDSALAHFNKAIQINNNSILANYWAAQIYLKNGDRERALTFFEKSLKQAPNFFSSLYIVGELNFMKGDTLTAIHYYESALAVKKDAGLLIKIGLFYEYNKDYQKAIKYYKEVIELVPDNFIGYNQLAWLYAKRGVALDSAMEFARKADTLQPGNASILDTIGWIYFHDKNYTTALEYLKKAHKINPNNPSVLYHIGATQNRLGYHSTAKQYFEKALQISSTFEGADDARKQLSTQ